MKKNLIAKTFALFLITAMISSNIAFAAKKPVKIPSVGATVTGYVDLLSKTSLNFPDDLLEIYKGSDSSITIDPKGKRINVKGTYVAGASFVSVEEDKVVSSSIPKYRFDLPIPAQVSSHASGRFTTSNTYATLSFVSQDDIDGDSGSGGGGDGDDDGDGNGGNSSLVKLFKKRVSGTNGKKKVFANKFKTKLRKLAVQRFLNGRTASISDFGALMSVKKVTATRKGNKGIVKGTFVRTGSSAKGRFALKMTFD